MADIFEIVGKLSIDGIEKAEKDLTSIGETGQKTSSKLGSVIAGIGKGVLAVTGTAVTGAISLVKGVSSAYGQLQQSIGGVETLFKESADKVIENANNAYKTAGLSANDYMQQVTSFSASLLQALDGDTEKACETADMAITDMADNANKMGTSMEMIQNAYQGFAKQNYTMLDNLKLGYGGTKGEMERLLADAEKITGIKYDISNLNDVYQAIHVIQGELGITGTTAKEAGATIQGSFGSMASAWKNFMAGLGDPNADMKVLVENLANTIQGSINNITPVVENIVANLPTVLNAIIGTVSTMLPTLINTFTELIKNVIDAIVQLLPEFIPLAVDCILTVCDALIQNLPLLVEAGILLIQSLISGLSESTPTLIPVIVDALLLMVETLIDNIDLLIDASIKLVMGLAEGLIQATPILISKLPVLIGGLVNELLRAIPQLVSLGGQLLAGLFKGFLSPTAIANAVKSLFNGIVGGVKKLFGIKSPSRVMQEIGGFVAEGLSVGIDEDDTAEKSMKSKVDGLIDIANGSISDVSIGSRVDNLISESPLQRYQLDFNAQLNSLSDGFDRLIGLVGEYLPNIANGMDRNIVIDGNSLAVGMSRRMDAQLGRIATSKGRGNV